MLLAVRVVRLDRANLTQRKDPTVNAADVARARHAFAVVCALCMAAAVVEIAVTLVWGAGDHHATDGGGWFDHVGTVLMVGVIATVLVALYRPPSAAAGSDHPRLDAAPDPASHHVAVSQSLRGLRQQGGPVRSGRILRIATPDQRLAT